MTAEERGESVWEYPRPPAVDACRRHVRVVLAHVVLAESDRALRVLETSHPPTIYVPPDDARLDLLVSGNKLRTWCEFKGAAEYLDAVIGGRRFPLSAGPIGSHPLAMRRSATTSPSTPGASTPRCSTMSV